MIVSKKLKDFFQDVDDLCLTVGESRLICRLEFHNTVNDIPVLKMRKDGKSLINKSKIQIENTKE